MSEAVIGEIRLFSVRQPPNGWLACDGRQLEINDYQELYSLIGCTYGGDGSKWFNVPDLRGRLAIGAGTEPGGQDHLLGARFGREVLPLTTSQIPPHRHGFNVTNKPATSPDPGAGVGFGNVPSSQSFYIDTAQPTNGSIDFSSAAITFVGSNGIHANMMPWLAINFIICCHGQYPYSA